MAGDIDLNKRQLRILAIVAAEPCLPLTLTDLMDEDVTALRSANLVKTYWGLGGTHWSVSDAGHEALARQSPAQGGDNHGR